MALTSSKGRADCRALFDRPRAFRGKYSLATVLALSPVNSGDKQSSEFHMNKNEVEIREFEMHLTKFFVCALIS